MRSHGAASGPAEAPVDGASLREEEARMAWLRETVDGLAEALRSEPLTFAEAEARVAAARRAILARFPTKADVYEWVYAPRFSRILRERFGAAPREWIIRL